MTVTGADGVGASMSGSTLTITNTRELVFTNTSVQNSAWTTHSDSEQNAAGYVRRAAVALSGVTANHSPDVRFSTADAVSGLYSPVADSYAGGVYIYATEAPGAAINIPSIICTLMT